jgi:hypothetical protein
MVQEPLHGAGAVILAVIVQVGSAEKTAVTVQGPPVAGTPVRVYDKGETHGGGILTEPPQELETVKFPVAGGNVKLIVPVTLNVLVAD